MGFRSSENGNGTALKKRSAAAVRPSAGKHGVKLNPALKSWLDNVIIPALVEEYLAEIEKRNRLVTSGGSEVTSDQGG